VAGEDLDSSLIVPLIKRAEPEGAGGPQLPGELIAQCHRATCSP
jgi:hypothetical protein